MREVIFPEVAAEGMRPKNRSLLQNYLGLLWQYFNDLTRETKLLHIKLLRKEVFLEMEDKY